MARDAFVAEVQRTLPGALGEREAGSTVLLPRSAEEVASILQLARRLGGAVAVPGASGTPDALPMDLHRLAAGAELDEVSRLVHVQAGMPLGSLEARLLGHGLTLGLTGAVPETQVGEWLATGAPGARDHADDPVDQLVAGMEAVLPDGRLLAIRPAPRRAVGPDLVGAFVGARGQLGVIVGAHLVARPSSSGRDVAFLFESAEAAEAARAWIRGRGVRPARSRLAPVPEGTVLCVRVEGEGPLAEAAVGVVGTAAAARGGVSYPATDLPPARPPEPREPSAVVRLLAERLAQ